MLRTKTRFALLLALAWFVPAAAHAQGSLEPPGPPGRVMKTLQEVEPRTPVTGAILASGSYYLTENFSGQLSIDADNVSLDLNGFAIVPGEATGIRVFQSQNVKIHNGYIVDAGTESVVTSGIVLVNGGGIVLSDLRISDISGDCIDSISPDGLVTVERVQCERMGRGGIKIRQFLDRPLSVVLRDNVIVSPNIATNLTIGGILIAQNTANPSRMILTGNQVLNPRTVGFVIADAAGATALGEMLNNTASNCGDIGFSITADLLFAKNRSIGCPTAYTLIDGTRAAPVASLSDTPGAWDNIEE